MLNQECRVYFKRMKVFRNLQKVGGYIFMVGFIVTGTGITCAISALIKNINSDFIFNSLIFGLTTLCLANLITEIAYINEFRTYEKLKWRLRHYNVSQTL